MHRTWKCKACGKEVRKRGLHWPPYDQQIENERKKNPLGSGGLCRWGSVEYEEVS